MTYSLQFPNNYGLVVLTASATFFVSHWHAFAHVGPYRRDAKLPYPIPYATPEQAAKDPNAYAFNCAQRAHANFLENQTQFLVSLLIAGLEYPTAAAGLGAAWLVARVMYAVGYARDRPGQNGKGRNAGQWNWFPLFGLEGLAAYVGYKLLMGKS